MGKIVKVLSRDRIGQDFLQCFRWFWGYCLGFLLTALVQAAHAGEIAYSGGEAFADLDFTNVSGSEIRLEARQIRLAQVLDTISRNSGVAIHYSVLPEGLVTATCVGSMLEKVLQCLLGPQTGLIVRYRNGDAKADHENIAEAWVLGSKLEGNPGTSIGCAANGAKGVMPAHDEAERTEDLLKLVQSASSEERAQAVGALLADGRKDDPDVQAALEQALNDEDAAVRAQAISSLAHREGNEASAAIQAALNDSAVDVRLMAVDGIAGDAALLQQALNDSDESVRSLAAAKLAQLNQKTGGAD